MKTHPDSIIFLLLLAAANMSLLWGQPNLNGVFVTSRFVDGEWWRLLTYPFVHVSGYHLLIDGVGFALVYDALREDRLHRKLGLFAAAVLGSVALPLLVTPTFHQSGLAGLSGPAHGIMAVACLEWISEDDRIYRYMGWGVLVVLLGKCGFELLSGSLFLGRLHLGDLGRPVLACHLGGVLGGLVGYGVLQLGRYSRGRRGPLLWCKGGGTSKSPMGAAISSDQRRQPLL